MLDAFSGLTVSGEGGTADVAFVQDITARYFSACHGGLELGELVRLDTFSLQDSIAALEIMDPKMDNGVVDTAEATEQPYDTAKPLTLEELISIIDQLFASEMTWHTGSSLSQTLYTCLYLQKLLGKTLPVSGFSQLYTGDATARALLDKVLFPYVVATIKSCEICREEYMTGYLYEEEDVSSADFGLELLPFIAEGDVEQMLQQGITWLSEHRATDIEQESLVGQLLQRIKLRLVFFKILQRLDSPQEWPQLVEESLRHSSGLSPSTTTLSDLPQVFSTRIQRELISTSPPRPIISMSTQQAYAESKRMLSDLLRLLPIVTPARDEPSTMLAFFESIRRINPPTLPLVRSRLQNLFLEDKMVQHSSNKQRYLVRAIEGVCGPRKDVFSMRHAEVELPTDTRFQINRIVTEILSRLELPYFDYYKILCHNPGRQRRNLCKILADLDVLQNDAEVADQEIATLLKEEPKALSNGMTSLAYTISSWVFNTKLDISLDILLIGFETDLYKPFEWAMIYWQIDNTLYIQNEHLCSIVIDRLPKRETEVRARIAHRLLTNEALSLLCKAYMSLCRGLAELNVIRAPDMKFTSAEALYNSRMEPFVRLVSPPFLTHAEYVGQLARGGARSAMDRLRDASDLFTAARLKWVALTRSPMVIPIDPVSDDVRRREEKAMVGCCIANNLALGRLLKQTPAWFRAPERVVTYQEGKFSRWFPTVQID